MASEIVPSPEEANSVIDNQLPSIDKAARVGWPSIDKNTDDIDDADTVDYANVEGGDNDDEHADDRESAAFNDNDGNNIFDDEAFDDVGGIQIEDIEGVVDESNTGDDKDASDDDDNSGVLSQHFNTRKARNGGDDKDAHDNVDDDDDNKNDVLSQHFNTRKVQIARDDKDASDSNDDKNESDHLSQHCKTHNAQKQALEAPSFNARVSASEQMHDFFPELPPINNGATTSFRKEIPLTQQIHPIDYRLVASIPDERLSRQKVRPSHDSSIPLFVKPPAEVAWIKKGATISVEDGMKKIPYDAIVASAPFLDGGNDKSDSSDSDNSDDAKSCHTQMTWKVLIKWEWDKKVQKVACNRCIRPAVGKRRRANTVASAVSPSPAKRQRRIPSKTQASTPYFDADISEESEPVARRVVLNLRRRDTSVEIYGNGRCGGGKLPARQSILGKGNRDEDDENTSFNKAFEVIKTRFTKRFKEQDIKLALRIVKPPYGLQGVMKVLQKLNARHDFIGQSILKYFDGEAFPGIIMEEVEDAVLGEEQKSALVWRVNYDDGDSEELEYKQVIQYLNLRKIMLEPSADRNCRGRKMQALELFSGRGIITSEFAIRNFDIASIDNSDLSNATIKMDIRDIVLSELPFVPDVIWASPPCQTYSRMAGGHHRSVKQGELEKSDLAMEHNHLFLKMTAILEWAKKLHPHLLVVIENPVGALQHMPLMKDFEKSFELKCTKVNYCAFGRDEYKPTHLWTNDFRLNRVLGDFTCVKRCPFGRGKHPGGVQTDSHLDHSAIPQPLAEEIAEFAQSKFYFDEIRHKDAVLPSTNVD